MSVCSGPGQVQSLELSTGVRSLETLLEFLQCSFSGGTDVDAPLELSLRQLQQQEWEAADILMVTDGEIPRPRESLLADVRRCKDDLGLEVHGLLVGNDVTAAMEDLCTHLHVFKSWGVVRGRGNEWA